MSNQEAGTPAADGRVNPPIRNFATLLGALGYGQVAEELSQKVEAIVSSIAEERANTGRTSKGELILKLKFACDDQVEIVAEVTHKLPKPTFGKAVFWPTADGHLSTSNPKQGQLFGVRQVGAGEAQPARSVSAPTV